MCRADYYQTSTPKSRRDRRCQECYQWIRKGQPYVRSSWLGEDGWASDAVCLDCRRFIDAVMSAGLDDEGCYTLGGFYWDYATEYWDCLPRSHAPHWFMMQMHQKELEDMWNQQEEEEEILRDPTPDVRSWWKVRREIPGYSKLSQSQMDYLADREWLTGKPMPK